jgi:hypothetical protein
MININYNSSSSGEDKGDQSKRNLLDGSEPDPESIYHSPNSPEQQIKKRMI